MVKNINVNKVRLYEIIKSGQTNLTAEQSRLWFLQKLDSNYPINETSAYEINVEINLAVLQQAIAKAVDLFSNYRSIFKELYGSPIRVEVDNYEIPFISLNKDLCDKEDEAKIFSKVINKEISNKFNLSDGLLFRFVWISFKDNKKYLIFSYSKLISDAYTTREFFKFIFDEYYQIIKDLSKLTAYDRNKNPVIFKLERSWLQTNDALNKINYWKKQILKIPSIQIPTDRKRPAIKTHSNASYLFKFNSSEYKKIKSFAYKYKVDIGNLALCIFAITLSRYSKCNDFAVGIITNPRQKYLPKNSFGPAENILPLRFQISQKDDAYSILMRMDKKISELNENGMLPLKVLLEKFSISKDLSQTPLFQVMYLYENYKEAKINNGLFTARKIPLPVGNTSVDLTLNVHDLSHEIILRLDYNTDLFLEASIRNFVLCYKSLFLEAIHKPDQAINLLPILDKKSLKKLIKSWNKTESFVPRVNVHQLFEDQCNKFPYLQAVLGHGEKLTYIELNERANQLAHYLDKLNYPLESRIAFCMDRSVDTIVVMLAILKAGYAYVSIDPNYPGDFSNYIFKDSCAAALITVSKFTHLTHANSIKTILLDADWPKISKGSRTNLDKIVSPQNIAYLIYTSGSTGEPKAVMSKHEGVVNNILWKQKLWKLNENDRILHSNSFSFDPSVWATFWPLSVGAAVIITPSNYGNDSYAIVNIIKEENITVIGTVPSLISLLFSDSRISECKSLRLVLSGGEVLTKNLQAKVYEKLPVQLCNLYGPTEATIDATCYHCYPEDMHTTAPIGKPIDNIRIYILDENFQPVPTGVRGEIFIAGIGVAKGYYGLDKLTAECFMLDPFSDIPHSRMYRTGDIGRYLNDGNIEFLGRIDNQVKINGFRIELFEIEKVLNNHPEIKEAAVIVKKEANGDVKLIAFVSMSNNTCSSKDIKLYISEKLPGYMVPSIINFLPHLPKMPNGKVDYTYLSNIKQILHEKTEEVTQSMSATEKTVSKYFCEVLNIDSVSLSDDFFELGGNSLMLARLADLLFKHFDIALPLHQFFKIPTVAGVANVVNVFQRDGLDAIMMQKHISKLEEDANLDVSINPQGIRRGNFTNPIAVLLTGGTGYLGAFLLEQLLRMTKAKVYCLVRAKTESHALERIRENMRQFYIWKEEYSSRLLFVLGDLGKSNFGLIDTEWSELAQKIDVIYHNGALVNFAYPYSALKPANVEGTKEIFRLACAEKLKAVHYVSTIDVLLASHTPRPFLEDDAPLRGNIDIPGGYTGSKWVAEKIAHIAQKRGIPVCIYRPGLVMSHSETGATQTNDYILVAFRGFIPKGIIPDYQRIFDIVPVDYVAKSIIYISLQENSHGKFFHLFNPKPVSLNQFCEWTKTYGYSFDIVNFEIGRQIALQSTPEDPLYPLVPLIRDADPIPHRPLDPKYIDEVAPNLECKNTLDALAGSNITCPPMSENLTHLCLKYLVDIGYFPSPESLNVNHKIIANS